VTLSWLKSVYLMYRLCAVFSAYLISVTRYLLTRGNEGVASVESAEAAVAAAKAAAERHNLMKSSFPPLSNKQSAVLSASLPEDQSTRAIALFPLPTFPPSPSSPTQSAAAPDLDPDYLRSWASARLKDSMRYVFAQVCGAGRSALVTRLIVISQASDGSLVFMQPINARMLLHHVSETGCLPRLVNVPVIHSTNMTIDEDTRSRYKWMAHLPLFTPVTIADVDLSDVVGESTMMSFKQELLHRSLRWAQVCFLLFFHHFHHHCYLRQQRITSLTSFSTQTRFHLSFPSARRII
jgi:hypothetical protein